MHRKAVRKGAIKVLKDISVQTIVGLAVALILAAFGFLSTPFQNFVSGAASGLYAWLTATSPISRWWFWTIAITAIISVFCLIAQSFNAEPAPHEAQFLTFRRFGMVWRWRWYNGHPFDVIAYCPACLRMMRYTATQIINRYGPTEFNCQHCSHVQIEREGNYEETEKQVKIEIEHAVRTGNWKNEVVPTGASQ